MSKTMVKHTFFNVRMNPVIILQMSPAVNASGISNTEPSCCFFSSDVQTCKFLIAIAYRHHFHFYDSFTPKTVFNSGQDELSWYSICTTVHPNCTCRQRDLVPRKEMSMRTPSYSQVGTRRLRPLKQRNVKDFQLNRPERSSCKKIQ